MVVCSQMPRSKLDNSNGSCLTHISSFSLSLTSPKSHSLLTNSFSFIWQNRKTLLTPHLSHLPLHALHSPYSLPRTMMLSLTTSLATEIRIRTPSARPKDQHTPYREDGECSESSLVCRVFGFLGNGCKPNWTAKEGTGRGGV